MPDQTRGETMDAQTLERALRERIAELKLKLENAEAFLASLGGSAERKASRTSGPRLRPKKKAAAAPRAQGGTLTVTEAVMQVVRARPGIGRREVVDRAEPLMDSASRDPRKTAGTRLGQLIKDGKLIESEGGVYPAE